MGRPREILRWWVLAGRCGFDVLACSCRRPSLVLARSGSVRDALCALASLDSMVGVEGVRR